MRVPFRMIPLFIGAALLACSATAGEADSPRPAEPSADGGLSQWVKRWSHARVPGQFERGHADVLAAFRTVVADSHRSTVSVLCDGTQTAQGVVVRADGWIVTKASELSGKIECLLADGSRLPATKAAHLDQCDLALLKIAKQGLPVVNWSTASNTPAVGSWLITTRCDSTPAAIGVVSAPLQESPVPQPILGVRMNQADGGVIINHVMAGTGAARAGIRRGDVISSINGRLADSPDTITNMIGRLQPGDRVTLIVSREESSISVVATLGDKSRLGGLDQSELMDSLGGPLSRRRAGFPSVIQHDSVIRPRECGGPIVGLDGSVIGVNIARSSRVASLALPAEVVRQAIVDLMASVAQQPRDGGSDVSVSTAHSN